MKSLCGGGPNKIYSEPATIRPEDIIRKLRDHIDQQEKRELFLEHKVNTMAREAKEKMGKGDKKGMYQVDKDDVYVIGQALLTSRSPGCMQELSRS